MDFKIIAVDFDGTLCEHKWPEIGAPNKELIAYLKEQKATGAKLILWTCRVGEILENAVKWCAEQGLIFDTVNENLPEVLKWMGGDTRKVFADEYIDDRNFGFRQGGRISEDMPQSERMELWGCLIDVIEDWLVERGVTVNDIPNDEREDVEDAAIIFGDDYDYLADRFAEVIGISRDCLEKELLSKLCPNLDGSVPVNMAIPGDFDEDKLKERSSMQSLVGRESIFVDELKEYLNPDFYTKGVSAIERLIVAVRGEKSHQTIYFVCDKKYCGEECKNPDCHHTSDIHYAKNFHEEDVDGVYIECYEGKQYGQ